MVVPSRAGEYSAPDSIYRSPCSHAPCAGMSRLPGGLVVLRHRARGSAEARRALGCWLASSRWRDAREGIVLKELCARRWALLRRAPWLLTTIALITDDGTSRGVAAPLRERGTRQAARSSRGMTEDESAAAACSSSCRASRSTAAGTSFYLRSASRKVLPVEPKAAARRSTAQHGAARRSTAQHGAARRSTAQHGAARTRSAAPGGRRRAPSLKLSTFPALFLRHRHARAL
jgi:hypothetical protein